MNLTPKQPSTVDDTDELREIFDTIDRCTESYTRTEDKFWGNMHKYGVIDREKLVEAFYAYSRTKQRELLDRLKDKQFFDVDGVGHVILVSDIDAEINKLGEVE